MHRSLVSVKSKAQHWRREHYGRQKEPSKPWDEESLSILKRLSDEGVPIEEIAEKLGRTKTSIRIKLKRLGLQILSRGRKYTEEELNNLYDDWKYSNKTMDALSKKYKRGKEALTIIATRKGFSPRLSDTEFLSVKDLSEHIGVSKDTIKTWMKRGLKSRRCHTGKKRYLFLLEDVQKFLEEHQDFFDAGKISDFLFMEEPDWLKEKRIKDKSTFAHKNHYEYTNEEDLQIIQLRKAGCSLEEIAQKLRRTPIGIQSRLFIISAGNISPTYWSEEEIRILRENSDYMALQDLYELLQGKRSIRSIEWKCEKLGLKYHIQKS